ncbi:MAG: hypothetical protein KC613_25515, partial [Myxococcales bacterium]|nr:hypothetical protein [Myxococcales bacterium]
LVLPEPTVVAAGGEGADFDFDGLAASQPGLEPDASPRGLDGAEPISTPPQRGAGLDEAWPRREKRPSTGTLSMGVVAVARPGRPDLLDLDDWDADEAVAELPSARPAADPRDAAPTRAGAPQPGPRSDGPISMGPLDDVSWPSLPALTPSPSPAQEASGAPLPPGPPSAGPPAPPAPDEKGPSLEDRLAFDEEVAPLAPTTGALPLVAGAEFADPLMMAVPLVAEGHDLEWLDPSVPPAQIPPTPPPLPALDSWDELAIEEADGPGALGEDAPLPSVELEWAELDLAPASVDAPLGTDGSWGDLDDPFEGDLGDDGAQPPSWPADISGVEPLDLEADDLGLATPRPPAPPSLPPAVVRPAVPTKGPSRADRAAEARIRIAREPLAPAGWLMLAEAETGDPAVTVWLNDVLAWLQGRVEPAPAAGEPSEPVPERLRRAMVPEGVPPNLLLLLRSVGPSVAPAFGPVKGRTPQGRRVPDHEPLAALVRRMCRILEVPPVQAVLNDARPYTVGAEAGEPSRIVLGTAVFDGSDASGASFLVARTLIPLREGTLPATVLSDREFRAFLAALFDMLDASFPVRSRDQPTMERIRGWLDPLLAVHQRLAWEPLAHAAVSGLGSRSAATVRVGLEQYSARLALALADGFGGAMEMLRLLDFDDRPRGQLTRAEVEQFLADNDAARDLLVFAASPACLDARRWLARSTGR